jgi:hypothetical protein
MANLEHLADEPFYWFLMGRRTFIAKKSGSSTTTAIHRSHAYDKAVLVLPIGTRFLNLTCGVVCSPSLNDGLQSEVHTKASQNMQTCRRPRPLDRPKSLPWAQSEVDNVGENGPISYTENSTSRWGAKGWSEIF